jgi:uncharacterized protein YndB with AHSA1/START domain
MLEVKSNIVIAKDSFSVLDAFTLYFHTRHWWGCQGTLVRTMPGGIASWQWRPFDSHFSYITHGMVKQYEAGLYLQVENIWQYDFEMPEPLGPINLLIECTPQAGSTLLSVVHSGFVPNQPLWDEYYTSVKDGWEIVLPRLKAYLEAM